jgi:hypothetical protein
VILNIYKWQAAKADLENGSIQQASMWNAPMPNIYPALIVLFLLSF